MSTFCFNVFSLGPNELSFIDYVKEGWRREQLQDSSNLVPKEWLKTENSDTFLWHPNESLKSQDDQERFLFMDSESIDIQGKVWHFFMVYFSNDRFTNKRTTGWSNKRVRWNKAVLCESWNFGDFIDRGCTHQSKCTSPQFVSS